MKVLLVNPPSASFYYRIGLRFMPLGLAYVAAVLRNNRHRVTAVDLEVERINYRGIPYGDYDVVGVGSDTMRWPAALRIAEVAKAAGATVVAGGPHSSFLDEDALRTGFFDYIVRSEGEHTMLDLVNHLAERASAADVPGVSYLDGGQVVRTAPRPFIEDLDSIPMPARDLFKRRKYRSQLKGREAANFLSSRGCPFNCEFCSCSVFAGKRWRTRGVDNILDELEYLNKGMGYKAVTFFDDNFTLDVERTAAVCEGILRRGIDIKWMAFSRADTAVKHPEVVKLMTRAGLSMALIGFESANQDSLDSAGKKSTVETSFQAMQILRRYGVRVWGSFMIGFDNETEEMVRKTINFAKRLNPHIAQFTIVTPYPGTRLFERVKDKLVTTDWRKFWGGEPTFPVPNLSSERLKKLFRNAYTTYYARPRKLATWTPYLIRASVRAWLQKNPLKQFMADAGHAT